MLKFGSACGNEIGSTRSGGLPLALKGQPLKKLADVKFLSAVRGYHKNSVQNQLSIVLFLDFCCYALKAPYSSVK